SHQARFIECDPTGAVGDAADVVHGAQLDQWHAPACLAVDDVDAEIRSVYLLLFTGPDERKRQPRDQRQREPASAMSLRNQGLPSPFETSAGFATSRRLPSD